MWLMNQGSDLVYPTLPFGGRNTKFMKNYDKNKEPSYIALLKISCMIRLLLSNR